MISIINTPIYEYDLEHASISVMKETGLVSKKKIRQLEAMDKHERVVQTGLLLRENKELNKILIDAIHDAVKRFIELNEIAPHQILLQRRDAIFIIEKSPSILEFDSYNFRLKNKFDTYIEINRQVKLFYYSVTSELTVSGNFKLNSEVEEFIKKLLDNAYNKTLSLSYFSDFTQDFFEGRLPLAFYRSFEQQTLHIQLGHLCISLEELQEDDEALKKRINKKEIFFEFYDKIFKAVLDYMY